MKIAINSCYGGFCLSQKACDLLNCGEYDFITTKERTNPRLIEVIEKLGKEAGDNIVVVEIPDNSYFIINEYDGWERVVYSASEILKA